MIALEYVEQVTAGTLSEAKATYDALHERVHKLVTLIVGGAGGVGVYALGKIGVTGAMVQVLPLSALACWWLLIAGMLLLRGATSLELKAGSTSASLTHAFNRHWPTVEGEGLESQALNLARWDQLAAVDLQIADFCKGARLRAKALDDAYLALVFSPVIVVVFLFLAYRWQ